MNRVRRTLAIGIAMGVLAQLSAVGLLLASAWLIVRAAEQPPVLYLLVAVVSVRAFGISRAVLRYVERLCTHDVAFTTAIDHRIAVYQALERVAPQGLTGRRRGDLVSRAVADVTTMQDKLLRLRMPWWTGAAAALVVVVVVASFDLPSALVISAGVLISAAALRFLVARLGRYRVSQAARSSGALATELSEIAVAAPDVVAYGAYQAAASRAEQASAELAVEQQHGAGAAGLGSAIVLAITGFAVAVLAAASGGIDPVLIGVVLLAPIALVEPMDAWSEAERVRNRVTAAESRLAELTTQPSAVTEPESAAELSMRFDLEVSQLAVGWTEPVASDIDFAVAEGDVLAITGGSGVGKSTLAYTLLRLVEPCAGTVTLGGIDTRQLTGESVRTVVGYLGQDEAVFDTSIRENLRIAKPDATDDELLAALHTAGLGAFVSTLPHGLDTTTGEHGAELSGGERQRLCLARLVLGSHRVLVFDEPTEHLDSEAAAQLLEDILRLAPQRTVIVITHAPAVLQRIARHIMIEPAASRSERSQPALAI